MIRFTPRGLIIWGWQIDLFGIFGSAVLQRASKILEYRAHLTKQEEVKIAAEREEIRRAKQLMARRPSPWGAAVRSMT